MKILSVDDSRIIRKIINGAVDMLDHEFIEAENGQVALEVLSSHFKETGLIMLDWNMPVMDGLATLKNLKSDPRFSSIPVMMVTTEGETERIQEAISAGAEHYVSKPFTQEDLMTKIVDCVDPD